MDINEIKQVPIVDFLYILGIEPVKHKASGLWYHAPYRNDRNPSLRVSTDKNVWYDYGIARGGDIFNLAGEFINSNEFVAQAKFISETLGGSFPTSFPLSFDNAETMLGRRKAIPLVILWKSL